MRIGIPKEPAKGQKLVSATPDTVGKLIKLGYEVVVEAGAGALASYPDQQYRDAGAEVAGPQEVWQADIVTTLDKPPADKIDALRQGTVLISRLAPRVDSSIAEVMNAKGVTAESMDAVPRISRAQSMDVLSSMANIGGYRAVIEAANAFGRLFTGQVTAAGKMPPAKVYVIGAGVAGLAAIGTANSMGAIVKGTDVRAETADQVESMGGEFVAIPAPAQESSDGYAKEMSEEQAKAALKLYAQVSAESDIVITTAQIPGRPAPLLITKEAVAQMKPGSVIVDMAGGNCELTVAGETIVTENGVKILGYTDLAGRLPGQASQLYGQNIVNLLKLMTPEKDGKIVFNLDDEIVRGITLCHENNLLWPPPPISVSAAPKAGAAGAAGAVAGAGAETDGAASQPAKKSHILRNFLYFLAAVLGLALIAVSPTGMLQYYVVLMLAIVAGFYVITNVTHALHTPLMSETNAISGIILVGAILSLAQSSSVVVTVLACLAIVIASINIFGGFAVTHKMLKMFQKED